MMRPVLVEPKTEITADEAIALVKSKAATRTRYPGSPAYLDEVLVEEIEKLRAERYLLQAEIERLKRTAGEI